MKYSPSYGINIGAASGIVFGLAVIPSLWFGKIRFKRWMNAFLAAQREKMEIKEATFDGEAIIYQGPANHFLRAEGRGGWLLLTDHRLMFRSHGINIQNQPVEIAILNIGRAVATRTVGIIPNGLLVEVIGGSRQRFVVSDREAWVKHINEQIIKNQESGKNAV